MLYLKSQIYEKYVKTEDNCIAGINFKKIGNKSYKYEELLDIFVKNGKEIFEIYDKIKNSVKYDDLYFLNHNMPYIKEEMLNKKPEKEETANDKEIKEDKTILEKIIEIFNEYGCIVDEDISINNDKDIYFNKISILKLCNQLLIIYVLTTVWNGIIGIGDYHYYEYEYSNYHNYEKKLPQEFINSFSYVIKKIPLNHHIYKKEITDKERNEFCKCCKSEIVEYINKKSQIFTQATKRNFIYNYEKDTISYEYRDLNLLELIWDTLTKSMCSEEKSKRYAICEICNERFVKTGNNQKRCPKHNRDKICKQDKLEKHNELVEISSNMEIEDETLKKQVTNILDTKEIRKINKKELENVLEQIKSQKN